MGRFKEIVAKKIMSCSTQLLILHCYQKLPKWMMVESLMDVCISLYTVKSVKINNQQNCETVAVPLVVTFFKILIFIEDMTFFSETLLHIILIHSVNCSAFNQSANDGMHAIYPTIQSTTSYPALIIWINHSTECNYLYGCIFKADLTFFSETPIQIILLYSVHNYWQWCDNYNIRDQCCFLGFF